MNFSNNQAALAAIESAIEDLTASASNHRAQARSCEFTKYAPAYYEAAIGDFNALLALGVVRGELLGGTTETPKPEGSDHAYLAAILARLLSLPEEATTSQVVDAVRILKDTQAQWLAAFQESKRKRENQADGIRAIAKAAGSKGDDPTLEWIELTVKSLRVGKAQMIVFRRKLADVLGLAGSHDSDILDAVESQTEALKAAKTALAEANKRESARDNQSQEITRVKGVRLYNGDLINGEFYGLYVANNGSVRAIIAVDEGPYTMGNYSVALETMQVISGPIPNVQEWADTTAVVKLDMDVTGGEV